MSNDASSTPSMPADHNKPEGSPATGLHALAKAMHESANKPAMNLLPLEQECQKAVNDAFALLCALADSVSNKLAGSLRVKGALAKLAEDPYRPGQIFGIVHFLRRSEDPAFFRASPEEAVQEALAQSLRFAMREHDWLSYGLDATPMDPEQFPDYPLYQDFYKQLPALGPVGDLFSKLLAEELEWAAARAAAESHLMKMCSEAAEAGLLPRCFSTSAGSSMRLQRGCPGDSTWIESWSVSPPSGSFTSRGRISLLDNIESELPIPQWELPPLSVGKDAMWSALCQKLAKIHADGWPLLVQQGLVFDRFFPAAQVAMDRELISGASAEPAISPRKPRSL